jgi:hypothetical protein
VMTTPLKTNRNRKYPIAFVTVTSINIFLVSK